MKYVAGCLFSALLGCLFMHWLFEPRPQASVQAQQREAAPGPRFPNEGAERPRQRPDGALSVLDRKGLAPDEAINVAVYEKNNRGVVNITTKSSEAFLLLDVSNEGSGSGAVIDKAGHILTNYHVVEEAQTVEVTLYDGNSYEAKLVGADPRNDIAVMKIDVAADLLHPIEIGDSSDLKVGMKAYAIGNPFGLERTMTTGIISSVDRSLQVRGNWTIKSIIQIDAAVNPGNSGGPLLDSHGRLIGMNTAIATRTGQSAGVGFAIPSNLIRRVVPQLIEHGRVVRPEIGIQRVFVVEKGLRIEQVTPGGPAERAGLQGPRVTRQRRGPFVIERVDRALADVIVEVDGQPVATGDDLLGYIESKKPGETIELTIVREGKRIKMPVQLGSGEANARRKPDAK